MNIGFANIYSFRPHVQHLVYLSKLLKEDGNEVFFLTCDASVDNCYARSLKDTSKIKECTKCILGGVRSFSVSNITSISKIVKETSLSEDELYEIALSSSCTLSRVESEEEWDDEDIVNIRNSLYMSVQKTYSLALEWIKQNKLEAVVCFNGRMELTRAVTTACETLGIPYLTHERTWFGDGIQLIPNGNCLSLNALSDMVNEFDNKYLTLEQVKYAGRLIALRFLQQNTLEWRVYNKNPKKATWPIPTKGKKILILPSSRNEFLGHPEWSIKWKDNTFALDDLFDVFDINLNQVVVRFHPNWSETIGKVSGNRPHIHYKNWVEKRGIYYIDSLEKTSTYDLIQEADIVVLNNGSSAIDAGALGKQVICLGPSSYHKAGFLRVFNSKEDMLSSVAHIDLNAEVVMRKTLRFIYVSAKRFPQFVNYVKADTTTEYTYLEGADVNRLTTMIRTGKLDPDDREFSSSPDGEDEVIKLLIKKDWKKLNQFKIIPENRKILNINRRFGFQWVDKVRKKLQLGDR
jgi:hypothetical protein